MKDSYVANLESLQLDVKQGSQEQYEAIFTAMQHVFSSGAIKLQRFIVNGPIKFCFKRLTSLTFLHVHVPVEAMNLLLDPDELRAAIGGMPNLQALVIHGSIFRDPGEVSPDDPKLILPALESLEISTHSSDIASLLGNLNAPRLTRISLHMYETHSLGDILGQEPADQFAHVQALSLSTDTPSLIHNFLWGTLEKLFPGISDLYLSQGMALHVMTLALNPLGPVFWPSLQRLVVSHRADSPLDIKRVIQFINARRVRDISIPHISIPLGMYRQNEAWIDKLHTLSSFPTIVTITGEGEGEERYCEWEERDRATFDDDDKILGSWEADQARMREAIIGF